MAQQFLNHPYITARIYQMGGEAVPQGMGVNRLIQA
jgi:hypothetical protein